MVAAVRADVYNAKNIDFKKANELKSNLCCKTAKALFQISRCKYKNTW